MVEGGQGVKGIGTATGIAIPLAVAGLFLTMIVRTISTAIVHVMDAEAKKGNWRMINLWQWIAVCLQGLRIAIPAALLLAIPSETVKGWLAMMPQWLSEGMTIGGGMVVAVGYAMVINMNQKVATAVQTTLVLLVPAIHSAISLMIIKMNA